MMFDLSVLSYRQINLVMLIQSRPFTQGLSTYIVSNRAFRIRDWWQPLRGHAESYWVPVSQYSMSIFVLSGSLDLSIQSQTTELGGIIDSSQQRTAHCKLGGVKCQEAHFERLSILADPHNRWILESGSSWSISPTALSNSSWVFVSPWLRITVSLHLSSTGGIARVMFRSGVLIVIVKRLLHGLALFSTISQVYSRCLLPHTELLMLHIIPFKTRCPVDPSSKWTLQQEL